METTPVDDRPDALAGRYRVDGVLAEGGMATVYRAWHCLLDQPVALKMLRSEFSSVPEIAQRFLLEARAVARLRSKHAVRVMDFGGTPEGNYYMVLELLNGKDLQQLLAQEGAQPVERAVDFVLQAADAVAEAHSTGLVHRDIKPANLFLAAEDGTQIIKVIDFGICKSLCRKSEYRTLSKSYLGSPQYMSPEQIQSAASVDARSDIWSLGVVLYELVTGHAPFRGTTLPALCASVMADTPTWPDHLPEELGRIVMRCLAKRREDRYSTVPELVNELAQFASARELPPAGSEVRSIPPQSNVRPTSRMNGWLQKATVSGVLTASAVAFGWGVDTFAFGGGDSTAPSVAPELMNAALEPVKSVRPEPTLIGASVQRSAALAEGELPLDSEAAPDGAMVPLDGAVTAASAVLSDSINEGEPAPPPETMRSPGSVTKKRVRGRLVPEAQMPEAPMPEGGVQPDSGKPSTTDVEARYALTYQPDSSPATHAGPDVSPGATEAGETEPPIAHSDL